MPSATSKGVTKDKHGRHTKACKAYRSANLRERHKIHNLAAHVTKYPNDVIAFESYSRLSKQFIKALPNGKGLRYLGISY